MVRNGLIIALLAFGALCTTSFGQIIDADSDQTMMVPTCGHLGASESLFLNSSIELNITSISFILNWANSTSNPEIILRTPSGHEINQFADLPIIYEKNDTMIYYIIPNPEMGNWTEEIISNDVSSNGEDYCLFIVQDTSEQPNQDNYTTFLQEMANSSVCETCSEEG